MKRQKDLRSKRLNNKKTNLRKDKSTKRQIDKETRREFKLVMSGQFCTLTMFYTVTIPALLHSGIHLALWIMLEVNFSGVITISMICDFVFQLQWITVIWICTLVLYFFSPIDLTLWICDHGIILGVYCMYKYMEQYDLYVHFELCIWISGSVFLPSAIHMVYAREGKLQGCNQRGA